MDFRMLEVAAQPDPTPSVVYATICLHQKHLVM